MISKNPSKLKVVAAVVLIFITMSLQGAFAQVYNTPVLFYTYYNDYKLANPALVGKNNEHVITSMYSGVFGNSLEGAPKTFYGSYETRLEKIKSGVGAMVVLGELGVHSYFSSRLLFSKQLPLSDKSGFRFGTQLLYDRSKIDYDKFRYIVQGDPVLNFGEEIQHNFNIDFGVTYYSANLTYGASIKNIIDEETISKTSTLNLLAAYEMKINNWLELNPSLLFLTNFTDNRFDINTIFEIYDWVMIGGGYRFPQNGRDNITLNAGVNIKDWVQVITLVYASGNHRLSSYYSGSYIETMVRVKIPGAKKIE